MSDKAKFKDALRSTNEIEITVTGRRSGRKYSTPVWFVLEDNTLLLLPVSGSGSNWFKNASKTNTIRVSAGGVSLTRVPKAISDKSRVNEIVDKFRARYGAGEVKKYYSKFDTAMELSLP